ncbi:VOC family protein [Phytoactinopolyspora limicola]|uniref:VOC family protein n=1 Tax=Phytoactinopolyspora limicola TaxID=2715536 RepID=UPI00140B7824|nr:VOC family protein [Phytoactinopolyspora limicola]
MTTNLVWFELPGASTDKARAFYSGLFGWTFSNFGGQGYHMVDGANPGGAITSGDGSHPVAYFSTEDINASVAKVKELGGTAPDPMEIPGVGRMALCQDDQGTTFGLYEPGA